MRGSSPDAVASIHADSDGWGGPRPHLVFDPVLTQEHLYVITLAKPGIAIGRRHLSPKSDHYTREPPASTPAGGSDSARQGGAPIELATTRGRFDVVYFPAQ